MRKYFKFIVSMLFLLLLAGCSPVKERIIFTDESGKDIYVKNVDSIDNYDNVVLNCEIEGQKKNFLFNIHNENFQDILLKEERESTKDEIKADKNGNLVIDKIDYKVNLIELGFIEKNGSITFSKTWSNKKRYLLIAQATSKKSVLIDVEDHKIIELPVKGYLDFRWLDDDKNVIINHIVDFERTSDSVKVYCWNIETNNLIRLDINFNLSNLINLSPNGKTFYYFSTNTNNDVTDDVLMCFDLQKNKWQEVYSTKMGIDEKNILWLSDEEIVFPVVKHYTLDPIRMLNNKKGYYIIKVNVKNKSKKEIKLNANIVDSFFWDKVNKYIYFIEQGNLYKTKIDFK